jgi:hypothetical protein
MCPVHEKLVPPNYQNPLTNDNCKQHQTDALATHVANQSDVTFIAHTFALHLVARLGSAVRLAT